MRNTIQLQIGRMLEEYMLRGSACFHTTDLFDMIFFRTGLDHLNLNDIEDFCKEPLIEIEKKVDSHELKPACYDFSYYAGLFISNLYNKIIEKNDVLILDLKTLRPLDFVGARHQAGKLIVNGDVNHFFGYSMYDGEIVLNGNAGDELGAGMFDGVITANGNVKKDTGINMRGGKIYLNGEMGDNTIEYCRDGGEIYHKGILIKSYKKRKQMFDLSSLNPKH